MQVLLAMWGGRQKAAPGSTWRYPLIHKVGESNMLKYFRRFRDDEYGAVTVDWVILTAVVMAAIVLLTSPLREGAENVLAAISSYLDATGTEVAARGSALD